MLWSRKSSYLTVSCWEGHFYLFLWALKKHTLSFLKSLVGVSLFPTLLDSEKLTLYLFFSFFCLSDKLFGKRLLQAGRHFMSHKSWMKTVPTENCDVLMTFAGQAHKDTHRCHPFYNICPRTPSTIVTVTCDILLVTKTAEVRRLELIQVLYY